MIRVLHFVGDRDDKRIKTRDDIFAITMYAIY